jgi:hypothetical protein
MFACKVSIIERKHETFNHILTDLLLFAGNNGINMPLPHRRWVFVYLLRAPVT